MSDTTNTQTQSLSKLLFRIPITIGLLALVALPLLPLMPILVPVALFIAIAPSFADASNETIAITQQTQRKANKATNQSQHLSTAGDMGLVPNLSPVLSSRQTRPGLGEPRLQHHAPLSEPSPSSIG